MNKTVARTSKLKRPARVCLTEGAIYRTTIAPRSITVTVECPAQIDLCARDPLEHMRGTLEDRVHDAMEWVLGPWFYHAIHAELCICGHLDPGATVLRHSHISGRAMNAAAMPFCQPLDGRFGVRIGWWAWTERTKSQSFWRLRRFQRGSR